MSKRIYVGNLPRGVDARSVSALFSQYGAVMSVDGLTDPNTGRPTGYCYVEMDDSDADRAIGALDGREYEGNTLNVNEERPRP